MKVKTYLQSKTAKVIGSIATRILTVIGKVDDEEGDNLQIKSKAKRVNRHKSKWVIWKDFEVVV